MQTLTLANDDLNKTRKANPSNHLMSNSYNNFNHSFKLNELNDVTNRNDHYNQNDDERSQTNNKTKFERLLFNIRNNPGYSKQATLGRLIGFYNIGSEIGIGNFSQVRLGLHLLTQEKVAIKILNKVKLDEKTQRLLLREISSVQKLHHPNIIRLYEVINTQSRLYICMEYAPEGELYTRITDHGKIDEIQSRIIFSQIISAVDHMHSKNIIHRDIKAENILFSNMNPIMVKVGDFGFSTESLPDRLLNTYCGSPPYAAPELFKDDNYIGIYVDIWALGVLLYFMVTGMMPFRAETVSKLKRVILNGDYVIPAYVSNSCQLLIRGILKPVPVDRFSIKEIMDSAWLDSERFINELNPYQLNPLDEKAELLKEELLTRKYLEKLGISLDYLTYSNLEDMSEYDNRFENSTRLASMSSLIDYKTQMKIDTKSNTNLKKLMSNVLTPDVMQSINGTYRIVFHLMQKQIRNEYNSENLAKQQYFNSANNTQARTTTTENIDMISPPIINAIRSNNNHYQTRMNDYDKVSSNENFNAINKPNYHANAMNGTNEMNNKNKSIFVKLNTQQMNDSNKERTSSNVVYQINRQRTKANSDANSNNNNNNNSVNNKSSDKNQMSKTNSRDSKRVNERLNSNNSKQTSKFCNIL